MSLRTAYPTLFRVAAPLAPSRWWTWRTVRRLLLACAVFATVIVLAYTVENWRARRAFASVAREAAAAGVSFDLRDLAPPPVPDAQNLARIPLLDAPRAKDAYDRFWDNLQDRLQPRFPEGAKIIRSLDFSRPNPHRNIPVDLAAIHSEFHAASGDEGSVALAGYLEGVAPLLSELGEAAAKRPHLRYDYEWENFYAIPLRHLTALRVAARAASLQALVDLENRRPAAAAQTLLLPLRLSSALHAEPVLISQLTASDLGSIPLNGLWQGQIRHQWTTTELELFARHLADDNILAGFRKTYAMETAAVISICLQLAGPGLDSMPDNELLDNDIRRILNRISFWAPSGWAVQNAANVAETYLHDILPSVDVAAARVDPLRSRIRYGENMLLQPYHVIMRILLPSFDGLTLKAGQAKTTRDLARIAIALEQHLLTHGAYPDSLAPVHAADPALASLHDPFTGEAYRYRRDADGGFTLWGVGPNARDDGAVFLPEKRARNPYESPSDLVWRVPGR